jgi:hypothetical protein
VKEGANANVAYGITTFPPRAPDPPRHHVNHHNSTHERTHAAKHGPPSRVHPRTPKIRKIKPLPGWVEGDLRRLIQISDAVVVVVMTFCETPRNARSSPCGRAPPAATDGGCRGGVAQTGLSEWGSVGGVGVGGGGATEDYDSIIKGSDVLFVQSERTQDPCLRDRRHRWWMSACPSASGIRHDCTNNLVPLPP